MKNKKIFVQIASYRDTECKYTIDDLYSKAKNPEKINIGLNWQYSEEDNDIPFFNKKYTKNIRIVRYNYLEAKGVCWARSITQSLHNDETYTLTIDAHMRFMEHWDVVLINMIESLQDIGYKKPVITHYPPDYTLDGTYEKSIKKMAPFLKSDDKLFIFRRTGHEIKNEKYPILSSCIAAGFNFTLSGSIKDVPYDKYLYFLGEEITLAARLWTNGYDFFNPAKVILYHLYKEKIDQEGVTQKSRIVNLNQRDNDTKLRNIISKERVRHLLGTTNSNDFKVVNEIDKFGLGNVRTLHQFELFTGLNFQSLTRRVYTRTALLNRAMIPVGQKNEEELLLKYSTELKSFNLSSKFIKMLNILNINSLLHISCGKFNHYLNKLEDKDYLGVDFNQQLIANNSIFYRNNPKVNFINLNYICMPLPQRDCIVIDLEIKKMPHPVVWQILKNITMSKPKFIILIGNRCDLLSLEYNFIEPDIIIPQESINSYIWSYESICIYVDGLNTEESILRKKLYVELENLFSKIDDNIKNNIIKSLPIQSLSKVRENIFTEEVKQICKYDNNINNIINSIINIRFKILNNVSNKNFPFVNDKNSLLVMVLICEYCELKKEII